MNPTAFLPLVLVALLAAGCGDEPGSAPASAPGPTAAVAAPAATASEPPADARPAQDEVPLRTLDLGEALLVDVLREGTGRAVRPTSTVALRYEGRTETSDVPFVSTQGRYQPERFTLDPQGDHRPIEGLARALVGLAPGARVRVHVPGHLAYGPKGAPEAGIEANADLLFEVEILEVR